MDVINEKKTDGFIVYRRRWGVLATVALLNISCGAVWINYSSTATIVAEYYETKPSKINWFASMYFLFAIPFTFVASILVEKLGLKMVLHIGSALNTIGAIIRAFATSGIISNKNAQYGISIFGQMFAASANSFFLGIGPKISQIWFPDSQRDLSTSIGALSRPLGVFITQLSVPYIIQEPEDVPLNNYIWLSPALLTQIFTIVFITRSAPKTPPSMSSSYKDGRVKTPFKDQLKTIFTNVPYLLLFLALGGGIGFVFAFGALAQQILCPLGYSENFSGMASALVLGGGFFGAPLVTGILKKKPYYTEVTKLFLAAAAFIVIFMLESLLFANIGVVIAILSFTFGFFGVGALPVGLELAIEATFPVEETISSSFLFLSGQLQAMIIVIVVPLLASKEDDILRSSCGSNIPMNYKLPLLILMTYLVLSICLMIIFFKTDYNRQKSERREITEQHETNATKL